MDLLTVVSKYVSVLSMKYLSFFFLIPPVQSSPEEKLDFFPSVVYGVIIFMVSAILQSKFLNNNVFVVVLDTIMFFVLGFLILARVKSGFLY